MSLKILSTLNSKRLVPDFLVPLTSTPKTQPHGYNLLRGLPKSLKSVTASTSHEDTVWVSSVSDQARKPGLPSQPCQPQTPGTPWLPRTPSALCSLSAHTWAPKVRMRRGNESRWDDTMSFPVDSIRHFGWVYSVYFLALRRGCIGRWATKDKGGEGAPCSQSSPAPNRSVPSTPPHPPQG